jgi:murein DD-endopeptidase MepM/ murein hydrolase activator NlpD
MRSFTRFRLKLESSQVVKRKEKTITHSKTTQLAVNHAARKLRQSRVFSKAEAVKRKIDIFSSALKFLTPKFDRNIDIADVSFLDYGFVAKRATAFAMLLMMATSVAAHDFTEDYSAVSSFDSTDLSSLLITDSDGYLTKVTPQNADSDRANMTDKAVHTVAAGEVLSVVASKYGVSEQTIVWENNLANKNAIRVGQKLIIPPVDGVTHVVKKGENVAKVASLYGVEAGIIKNQNRLDAEYLAVGQELIIPGGKKIIEVPRIIAANSGRDAVIRGQSGSRVIDTNLASAGTVAAVGQIFIFPTRGKITQGFRGGHYAYDIADVSKPPIWAAAGGTVVKASSGTYAGGYGNHVIIDHGNGYKTLYAHMDYLTVSQGQYVSQGEAIGRMGATGRVYGRTGIHLHFEVHQNGVKLNPGGFF